MPVERNRSLKWQRYEIKYLVSEAQAAEIRRYCRDHLPPDPYSSYEAGCEYPILSTYLDSPSRDLLRHTLLKRMNRCKLRMRTYRSCRQSPDARPAYFEIKRKINGIVHKTRARIEPPAAESLLWNGHALLDGSGHRDIATRMNVNEFQQLRSRLRAKPVIGVLYRREAYEGVSAERIRITLDRDLHYGLLAPPGNGQCDLWWPADPGGVILEVKFTHTYPFWVANMLRRVEVMRRGVCKYVICSQAAGVCPSQA
jgi:SPX domain protein involved in polyphosphate accumulation